MSYSSLPLAAGHSGRFAFIVTGLAVLQIGALIVGITSFGIGGAIIAPALAGVLFYPVQILLIRPYRAWDPYHDAGFSALAVAVVVAVIWLQGDIIAPLFAAP